MRRLQYEPKTIGSFYQNHRSNMPPDSAFTYGLIYNLPYIVMFDVSGNGLVQYDYAGPYGGEGRRTPEGWQIDFGTDQPYGADYMIVIATDQPVPQLEKTVKTLDERKAPLEIYQAVIGALKGRPYAMSVHERYSGDDAQFPELCRPRASGAGQ